MADSPNTITPLHDTPQDLWEDAWEAGVDVDYDVVDDGPAPNVYAIPARDLDVVVDHALRRAPTVDFERDAERAPGTPARDAYLDARAQAGAVGIALADPRMRRALILARLEHDQHPYRQLVARGL